MPGPTSRPRPTTLIRIATCAALAAGGAAAACREADLTQPGERPAELVSARVPQLVARTTPFEVVAVFGRGLCESPRPFVERDPGRLTLGLRVVQQQLPAGGACPDLLVLDSVKVSVVPPFDLPFTVRLQRGTRADSLFTVRERTS